MLGCKANELNFFFPGSLDMAKMRDHRPELKIVGIEPEKINWGTQMTPVIEELFFEN